MLPLETVANRGKVRWRQLNVTPDCAIRGCWYFIGTPHLVMWRVRARVHIDMSVLVNSMNQRAQFTPRLDISKNTKCMCLCARGVHVGVVNMHQVPLGVYDQCHDNIDSQDCIHSVYTVSL